MADAARRHDHVAAVLTRAGARLILDIGCGEGALRRAMPCGRIVGVDGSATMPAAAWRWRRGTRR
ncbi:class I SAM-dependent methyltransferase [Thermoactinospora rubra]|uniref:methyltransferase domain-containing protein n=1 Tax=Thermoactinospora rubra TaxID=1088767 RepID=UPI000A0FD0B7|nr:class I SAM-dependent methyltransferase [Thermoactinospora rubra]